MSVRVLRGAAASLALLVAGLSLQVVAAPIAGATSCSMVGSGLSRHQHCTGLRHEYIGSKFSKGTADYFDGQTQNVEASIEVFGRLKDKVADGNCTWLRYKVTNSYWPNGNIVTSKKYRVCGAGESKKLDVYIHGAYTYPGSKVEVQHCQNFHEHNQNVCTTFFKRHIPE